MYINIIGLPISEKAPPIGRHVMDACCSEYLRMNTADALKKRCVITVNYAAVGRTGECAKTSVDSFTWDYDVRCLCFDWSETKVSKQKFMNFFPDREYYSMDVYHALACYFMVGGGTEYASISTSSGASVNSQAFLFPYLAGLSSPSTTINGYIKELIASKRVLGLPDAATGTSFRIGGTNVMSISQWVELHHVIMRGTFI